MTSIRTLKIRLFHLLSKPEYIFLLISLFFGSLSAFLVPQLSVADEHMHYMRAYSISELQFKTTNCTYPKQVSERLNSVQEGDFRSHYKQTVNPNERTAPKERSCGSAAGYSPIIHLPQATGIAIAKAIHPSNGLMILFGRLANVIAYSLILFLAIKYTRVGKWPLVVISSLPIMIHLSGSLSSDALNNAFVISFIAYVLSLAVQKKQASQTQITILLGLILLLSFTKLPNLLLLSLLILVPKDTLRLNIGRFKINKYGTILAGVALAAISVYIWQKIAALGVLSSEVDNPLHTAPWYFGTILFNTYVNPLIGYTNVVAEGVIDQFSAFRYSLPNFLELIIWTTLGMALLYKAKEPSISPKQLRVIAAFSLCLLVLLVSAISYGLYSAWAIQPFRFGPSAEYADGVQGRYFTAFLALLIPIALCVRQYISISTAPQRLLPILIVCSIIFSLSFYTITTYFFKISLP